MADKEKASAELSQISSGEESDWDEQEEERLYRCVENGDLGNVKEILASGKVRFNKVYEDKELHCGEYRIMGRRWTLIHVAVLRREIEILKNFIRQGADINDRFCTILNTSHYYFGESRSYLTPLMLACVIGDMSAVEILLENGANTSSMTIGGDTALKLAFANGRIQIVERLIPKINDYELHEREVPLFFHACFGGQEMVELWLKIMKNEKRKRKQLKPNYKTALTIFNREKTAAIHWAVAGVQIEVVNWLCERGFQLSNTDYWNVFHVLANSNQKEESDQINLLTWLLSRELPLAMIDVAAVEGTPLSLACCSKNFRFAAKLLEYGVQRKFDVHIGRNLLLRVIYSGDRDVAKGISELKIKFSGLGLLAIHDNFVRDRKVFDSFVTEEVLVAGMPGVFHWAAWYGSSLSLDHLLRHGANLEEKDDEGCTPIMRCSTVENLKWFVEHNANYRAVDRNGNSLLLYGMYDSVKISVLEYLLDLCLSLEAENNDGKKPHEVAQGEVQIFLKAKYEKMLSFRLLDSTPVKPECVQTCLVGDPMAGKTTLTNSLCGIAPQSDESQSDELDRTAGVDVHNKQVDGVGLMSIWDFGGDYPFRVAHAILFRFVLTIFLCVVNLDDGKGEKQKEAIAAELRGWLAFLKSARKSIVSGITIVVVGNKRTGDNPDNDMTPSETFRILVDNLVEMFNKSEPIFCLGGVFKVDCKKRQSEAMNLFRCKLKGIRRKLIENADSVPKVSENCRSLIVNSSNAENKLLNLEEFRRTVEELLSRPLIKDVRVESLAQNLHDSGTILYFHALAQIYLQPSVLVTNLLGPILSDPDKFYIIRAVKNDTGRVKRENIKIALELFQEQQRKRNRPFVSFTVDEAIQVMLDLHLICQIEGKDGPHSYHVPCLIKESKPARVWEKRDDMVVYRGRRYRVSHPETDVIPPPLFPVLQSRCAAISRCRMILWKNGFTLEASGQSHLVECLVEITNENDAVDVIVRCWKGGERFAKDMLEDVKRIVESVRNDKANGTPMEWCYLDSDDLQNHSSDVAVYELDDIRRCESSIDIVYARNARDGVYPHIEISRLHLPPRTRDGEPQHQGHSPTDIVCKDLIVANKTDIQKTYKEVKSSHRVETPTEVKAVGMKVKSPDAQELELKDYEIAAFDQKKEYRDQAQAMLDAWANAHYKKATRRRLIKAMKDEGLEKAAAGVFSREKEEEEEGATVAFEPRVEILEELGPIKRRKEPGSSSLTEKTIPKPATDEKADSGTSFLPKRTFEWCLLVFIVVAAGGAFLYAGLLPGSRKTSSFASKNSALSKDAKSNLTGATVSMKELEEAIINVGQLKWEDIARKLDWSFEKNTSS
ncbi:death-associated protein kinase 1-like isoform X2 [Oscarella lobularis]|uniref:death-associated protein kinase 1-like isoform X2 n=1 Tax=Oscarella lobularis TaxID=121494 RepID=UPI003313B4A0